MGSLGRQDPGFKCDDAGQEGRVHLLSLRTAQTIRIRGQCPYPSLPCQAFGTKVNGREKATYLGAGSIVSKGESFLTLT